MTTLSKSEKAMVKQRKLQKGLKLARRFVGKNLWRCARIKAVGSDGRKDNERLRRFNYCLKAIEARQTYFHGS